MPSGQLSVTPVTVRGLEDMGLGGSRTFVGCYLDASEKHRTRSMDGPEPEWNHTLYCNVSPGNSYLQVELVNEDPESPGVVGGARVPLFQVFNEGSVQQWVTIISHQNEPVAQLLLNLDFKGEYAEEEDAEEERSRAMEEEQEEDEGTPKWMKYGGAALGAAAVVGLGMWAYHEYKEDKEEEEREAAEDAFNEEQDDQHHLRRRHSSGSSSSSSSSSDED